MAGKRLLDGVNRKFITWCTELGDRAKPDDPAAEHKYDESKAYRFALELLPKDMLAEATADTIENFMLGLPSTIEDRVKDAIGLSDEDYPLIGLYVSALCTRLPITEYKVPTGPLFEKMGVSLDHLFYEFPNISHNVVVDGPVGNSCFLRAKIYAEVTGKAGNKNAVSFKDGRVKFASAGYNTAEAIEGGDISIKISGKNTALNGKGGTVKVDFAGDNLGRENRGTSIFGIARIGKNMGYGMVSGVIRAYCVPDEGYGAAMKGGDIELYAPFNDYNLNPPKKTGGRIILCFDRHLR